MIYRNNQRNKGMPDMDEFKYIPKEFWPKSTEHIDYAEVYRASMSVDVVKIEDFVPSNIEHKNQKKTFKNTFEQSEFSVSLSTSLDSLKKTVSKFPSMSNRIKAYAKGKTSIKRGISTEENPVTNHVNYFLYDYIDNSPKDDFQIIEVRTI